MAVILQIVGTTSGAFTSFFYSQFCDVGHALTDATSPHAMVHSPFMAVAGFLHCFCGFRRDVCIMHCHTVLQLQLPDKGVFTTVVYIPVESFVSL